MAQPLKLWYDSHEEMFLYFICSVVSNPIFTNVVIYGRLFKI